MKDSNGVEIRLGDRVRIYDMDIGIVVVSVDTDEYSDEFPQNDWGYLKSGVMVKTDTGAIVHLEDLDPEEPKEIVRIS